MVTHARIVLVRNGSHLRNSTGHECRYRAPEDRPLIAGRWYIVTWPDAVEEPLFDAAARYAGPYHSEEAARKELANARAPSCPGSNPRRDDADSPPAEIARFPDRHCLLAPAGTGHRVPLAVPNEASARMVPALPWHARDRQIHHP